MRTLQKMWDRSGDGWMREKRFLGVWFFRRIEDQRWSKTMAERRHEYGIRIRGVRLAVSWVDRHWNEKVGRSVDRCVVNEF